MSALDLTADSNPQTQTGVGGAQPLAAPALSEDFSQYYMPFDPLAYGAGAQLLSAAPASATDSTYLQENAVERNQLAHDYGAALAALGYTDPNTGAYIPGSLVSTAQIQEAQAQQQRAQAILQNTQNAQQNSILFSGMRGTMQAQAEQPYVQQIASIENQLPLDMANYLGQAKDAINAYNTTNEASLSAAAARAAQALTQNPITPPPSSPGTVTSGTPTSTPAPATSPSTTDPNTAYWQAVNEHYGLPTSNVWATPAYPKQPTLPMAMAHGGEVDGATPAIVGEGGPEAVVPRTGLTPAENDDLTQLRQVAQQRLGGGQPGIHWFGPGGAGVIPTPPQIPQVPPAQLLQNQGLHDQAVGMWMQHHPGAMLGRARGVPGWVHAAVQHALSRLD